MFKNESFINKEIGHHFKVSDADLDEFKGFGLENDAFIAKLIIAICVIAFLLFYIFI